MLRSTLNLVIHTVLAPIMLFTLSPLRSTPQVQYHGMSASVCDAARRMGGDKVRTALELVGCAEEVDKAIKYTFGTAFVCQVWKCVDTGHSCMCCILTGPTGCL